MSTQPGNVGTRGDCLKRLRQDMMCSLWWRKILPPLRWGGQRKVPNGFSALSKKDRVANAKAAPEARWGKKKKGKY